MKHEKSCGCIIISNEKVLLVQNRNGNWAFPKGHVEKGETEKETALRETKEETNLDVEIISEKKYVINYISKKNMMKKVIYFVAKPLSNDYIKLDKEISNIGYYDLDEALDILTYQDIKDKYQEFLNDYRNNNL